MEQEPRRGCAPRDEPPCLQGIIPVARVRAPEARASLHEPFLPAGRASLTTLQHQADSLEEQSLLGLLLAAIPGPACIINAERQIVAANSLLLAMIGAPALACVLGDRPGEALGCIRSGGEPDGCGTTRACAACGVAQALRLAAEAGHAVTHECRLTVDRDGRASLDVEATVTPLAWQGQRFQVLSLRDISGDKRREVLERAFFQDVRSAATGIHGLARLAADPATAGDYPEAPATIAWLASDLVEKVELQRTLRAAEQGDCELRLATTDLRALLLHVTTVLGASDLAGLRTLHVAAGPPLSWPTDPAILQRVLGALVTNALEATPPGGTVTLAAERAGDGLAVRVHNPGVMAPEVQLQVYQRSFSTKGGTGRGIGTYAARLFVEQVLGGQLSFTSAADTGTTFTVLLPAA